MSNYSKCSFRENNISSEKRALAEQEHNKPHWDWADKWKCKYDNDVVCRLHCAISPQIHEHTIDMAIDFFHQARITSAFAPLEFVHVRVRSARRRFSKFSINWKAFTHYINDLEIVASGLIYSHFWARCTHTHITRYSHLFVDNYKLRTRSTNLFNLMKEKLSGRECE